MARESAREQARQRERPERPATGRPVLSYTYSERERECMREGEKCMHMKALCLVLSLWLTEEFLPNELN